MDGLLSVDYALMTFDAGLSGHFVRSKKGAEQFSYVQIPEGIAMAVLLAFLHDLAAFTLAAAVALQFDAIRGELDAANARRLSAADAVLGLSELTVLILGLDK